ncbi:NHLP leader peptide family natural product precursor [Magnetospirillum sulfuroxidans]|nr:NHLP leader peptide family natural product precursor [Magnetospirillum sulfuroxidans]
MTTENPLAEVRRHAEKLLTERAQSDATFRTLLKDNPHAALKQLLGTDPVPALKITVIEEQPGEAVIVLPAALDASELPDELLDLASGGISFSSFVLFDEKSMPKKPAK